MNTPKIFNFIYQKTDYMHLYYLMLIHFLSVSLLANGLINKSFQFKPSLIHLENLNLLWRPLRVLCPYKAWKPQLVQTHLWHSPCKRQHVSSTTSVAVECHSMWKHPEHLIITLIKPAHKIRCCRGLKLAYLRLQQHHVWWALVHRG